MQPRSGEPTRWSVWSQVSVSDTTPANIGDIKIDATIPTDVFEMSLLNATGGPGAANVGSIILSDGVWTGHSSLLGGHITGNLTGGLEARVDSSDNGGTVVLTVDGDLTNSIEIKKDGVDTSLYGYAGDLTLVVGGVISAGIRVGTIKRLEAAALTNSSIKGDITGPVILGTINTDSTIGLGPDPADDPLPVREHITESGSVTIDSVDGVSVLLSINYAIDDGGVFTIKSYNSASNIAVKFYGDIGGVLTLHEGVESGVTVVVAHGASLLATGRIYLKDANGVRQSVGGGGLFLDGGTKPGSLIEAGELVGQLVASLGGSPNVNSPGDFAGEVIFSSIAPGATIWMSGANEVFSGTVTVDGDMAGQFSTCISGGNECMDFVSPAKIVVGGNLTGRILTTEGGTATSALMSGEILIGGSIDDTATIDIGGDMSGLITSVGDMSGQISVGGLMSG
ncbi:MAG: hypothetical protein IH987_20605, partial [Planctomycetes bacterium]|nr:hypothetical protein [Planctomycetota bacterium]